MDEVNENDGFVLKGEKVLLEKGERYRIVMRDGREYEGIYDGYAEGMPWCQTVTLTSVVQITSNGILNCEEFFMSFEKARIGSIEKSQRDLQAMMKIIEPDRSDYNFGKRMN
jgi:hypothetical protein